MNIIGDDSASGIVRIGGVLFGENIFVNTHLKYGASSSKGKIVEFEQEVCILRIHFLRVHLLELLLNLLRRIILVIQLV